MGKLSGLRKVFGGKKHKGGATLEQAEETPKHLSTKARKSAEREAQLKQRKHSEADSDYASQRGSPFHELTPSPQLEQKKPEPEVAEVHVPKLSISGSSDGGDSGILQAPHSPVSDKAPHSPVTDKKADDVFDEVKEVAVKTEEKVEEVVEEAKMEEAKFYVAEEQEMKQEVVEVLKVDARQEREPSAEPPEVDVIKAEKQEEIVIEDVKDVRKKFQHMSTGPSSPKQEPKVEIRSQPVEPHPYKLVTSPSSNCVGEARAKTPPKKLEREVSTHSFGAQAENDTVPWLIRREYEYGGPSESRCFTCSHHVYDYEKLGPVKGLIYHHWCLQCSVCYCQLTMKTFCTNSNNLRDKKVYCKVHRNQPK